MQDIRFKYFNPIMGGTPKVSGMHTPTPSQTSQKPHGVSFEDVLSEKISTNTLNFSKHAAKRVIERNIDLSEEHMARLNEGVKIAGEKKLSDALILIDQSAFVVNIPTNTVITTKSKEDGNVFTNINGTVII